MGATLSKEEEARIAQKQREEIDALAAKYKAEVISERLSRVRASKEARARAKKEAERLASKAAQSKSSTAPQNSATPTRKAKSGAPVVPLRPKKTVSDTNGDAKGVQKVKDNQRDNGR
ncbi:hypothetical protein EJ03DRAFT_323746 [Teratosphaeria nubilosa]|uniref:Uncharacterized protein n=1 Tax=Teratosphaeria nubilosa TaxID=161662 RepID=A0A6G1LLD7_9PEZI|nr:hypothetical protein EJ03DRAFT_323746 [Teratosphaeria nubilosa]